MRVNRLAILVSAVAFFILGGVWFWALGDPWAAALGSSPAAMSASNASWYPYAVAFLSGILTAYGLALILAWRGETNALNGAAVGFAMAVLIFGACTWMDYAFEHRGIVLGFINVGYVAVGMAVQGAILAAWRGKS